MAILLHSMTKSLFFSQYSPFSVVRMDKKNSGSGPTVMYSVCTNIFLVSWIGLIWYNLRDYRLQFYKQVHMISLIIIFF